MHIKLEQSLIILLLTLVSLLFCTPKLHLAPAEKEKLDPVLLQIISGSSEVNKDKYSIDVNTSGVECYGVIIRTLNAKDIEDSGVQLNSIQDNIATAKLTSEEIVRILRLDSVHSVSITKKDSIH